MTDRTVIHQFTIIREKMYKYQIEVVENGVTSFHDLWADNGREAVELGQMMFPHATFVELA